MIEALGLLGVAVLIAANGYFVAAEFAFVAARRQKFAESAEDGDRKSARALEVHKRLSWRRTPRCRTPRTRCVSPRANMSAP